MLAAVYRGNITGMTICCQPLSVDQLNIFSRARKGLLTGQNRNTLAFRGYEHTAWGRPAFSNGLYAPCLVALGALILVAGQRDTAGRIGETVEVIGMATTTGDLIHALGTPQSCRKRRGRICGGEAFHALEPEVYRGMCVTCAEPRAAQPGVNGSLDSFNCPGATPGAHVVLGLVGGFPTWAGFNLDHVPLEFHGRIELFQVHHGVRHGESFC